MNNIKNGIKINVKYTNVNYKGKQAIIFKFELCNIL